MPLRLSPLDHILSRLNLIPVPLFDTPLVPGIAQVLITACELNLFDTLADEPLTLDALAEKLDCHPQGLVLLLQVLVAAGYIQLHRGHYRNTRVTRRWLLTSSPTSIAPYIVHSPDIVDIWKHLPAAIRTHQPSLRMPYDEDASDPELQRQLARHYAGLAALATVLGGEVIRKIRLPAGASSLVDIGGSHAAYSAMLCRKYSRLQATILDIQPGIEAGLQNVERQGLSKRIHFVCTDIVRDAFEQTFPATFDAALYFQIAHLLQPEQNRALLAKVVATLKPGGQIFFVDQVTNQTPYSRLANTMVQLMAMTMEVVGGTCYPFPEVKDWLLSCGMEQVHQHRLLTPGATLITARKKLS
ncbi:class I SAM-dependent methyltransferase [Dictyobacter kobayashii]|uniref:Methyltransferase n=1 Tax=Dictyobacter kobayashii TaxID=2014872 RepID=A0A402AG71_9CHLR|nr:class I SAM-dependent methyltransferase [Dictyobacter kobayashii]GCE18053.1 methyltransferase [Dictyobacter kobayashii]